MCFLIHFALILLATFFYYVDAASVGSTSSFLKNVTNNSTYPTHHQVSHGGHLNMDSRFRTSSINGDKRRKRGISPRDLPTPTCKVVERNGYLKQRCTYPSSGGTQLPSFFMCVTSHTTYTEEYEEVCKNDPLFYQMCGSPTKESPSLWGEHTLCGGFLCTQESLGEMYNLPSDSEYMFSMMKCDGYRDCRNTALDEFDCGQTTLCDNVCNTDSCEDESNCNGYLYGYKCVIEETREIDYKAPFMTCNPINQKCLNEEDEPNCDPDITGYSCKTGISARHLKSYNLPRFRVPLYDYMRCFPVFNSINQRTCIDNMDQTNCSDPLKVGVHCPVRGYQSTVSIHLICAGYPSLCDDNAENTCVLASQSCYTHKHRLCDGVTDCQDGADETADKCRSLTSQKCIRRGGPTAGLIQFPLAWIIDGFIDCMDGIDEDKTMWAMCGAGITERPVSKEQASACEDVFLCLDSYKKGYVEFDFLCDGVESCGRENRVCKVSRNYADPYTQAASMTNNDKGRMLFTCLSGLQRLNNVQETLCATTLSKFHDHFIFGITKSANPVTFPLMTVSCDYVFGEVYVHLSCRGLCESSNCPLVNVPTYSSCPSQFQQRIGTYAVGTIGKPYLSFVTGREPNFYQNENFVCKNTIKCIPYSKVCDLVNDCGDHSDEESCTNHFKCHSAEYYIPKSQKCDGKFHCLDLSDECNDQCSKEILGGYSMKIMSWMFGIVAVLCNIFVLKRRIVSIIKCKNRRSLTNNFFILLICVGDLLVGSYILSVAIADTYFRRAYCSQQQEWLVTKTCITLGVMSTAGTHISIFAMTLLSIIRVVSVRGPIGGGSNSLCKKYIMKIILKSIVVASGALSVAILPVYDIFEDFFVNGMYFDPEKKLFIGFPDKDKHMDVIQAYYGRMRKKSMSWKMLNSMVDGMFSQQYTDFDQHRKKLHFYGNDGVCMFKYFVTVADPQKHYVWGVLALNMVCLAIIAISYIIITMISKKSSESLGDKTIKKRHRKTQRKITLLLATNLVCWIPFIVTCVLHTAEAIDATQWYSIFSMLILPINSVLNPFLYDEVLSEKVKSLFSCIGTLVSDGESKIRENIEMTDVQMKSGPAIAAPTPGPDLVFKNQVAGENNYRGKDLSSAVITTERHNKENKDVDECKDVDDKNEDAIELNVSVPRDVVDRDIVEEYN